jgi:uncharacterized protein YbjT (DUF2867 family)
MLVVFGANGRTGVAIIEEARRRGIPVRPVVRDDQDTRNLDYLVPVKDIFYADPESPDSLGHCLEGATRVISAIDARTAGPGAPIYTGAAASNILLAAGAAGAERIVHLSVMGAYRWSYAPLNRKSFHLESAVRACNVPWGLLRVSCYFDEILEGHVAPPDGGAPWPFARSSRYSPTSRRDAARMALDYLESFSPGRAQPVGGPEVFTGEQLAAAVARHKVEGRGRTRFKKLPPGDVSVAPTTTRGTVGYLPDDRLAQALEGSGSEPGEEPAERTVYPAGDPDRHPADAGADSPLLAEMGPDLRRVVHQQLTADLARLGLPTAGVTLDFSAAAPGERSDEAHHGTFTELSGVRVRDEQGGLLHEGGVDFLRDKLAEEFHVWWRGPEGIPAAVWNRLDMGVRRRLAKKGPFVNDPRVRDFQETRSERT